MHEQFAHYASVLATTIIPSCTRDVLQSLILSLWFYLIRPCTPPVSFQQSMYQYQLANSTMLVSQRYILGSGGVRKAPRASSGPAPHVSRRSSLSCYPRQCPRYLLDPGTRSREPFYPSTHIHRPDADADPAQPRADGRLGVARGPRPRRRGAARARRGRTCPIPSELACSPPARRSRSRCRRTSTRAASARATSGTTRAPRSSSGCAAGGTARRSGRADACWTHSVEHLPLERTGGSEGVGIWICIFVLVCLDYMLQCTFLAPFCISCIYIAARFLTLLNHECVTSPTGSVDMNK